MIWGRPTTGNLVGTFSFIGTYFGLAAALFIMEYVYQGHLKLNQCDEQIEGLSVNDFLTSQMSSIVEKRKHVG